MLWSNLKQKLLKRALVVSVLALALLMVLSISLPLPPYGRFRAEGIGNIGDAYYEFAGGNVNFTMTDGYGSHAIAQTKVMGSYFASNGAWFMKLVTGQSAELHATLWNMKICDTNGAHPAVFRRMCSLP
jgi:hypothetical protein